MANDTPLTVIGNLTADPELRFTQSGIAVASFTIASTPRTFNRQTGQWEDQEALFMRCSIWRDAAENVAESLEKGDRVVAQGNLVQRAFTDRDGNNRISIELIVLEVGPSLKYATAKPNKIDRRNGGGHGAPQGGYGGPALGQGNYPPQSGPHGGYAPQGAPQGGAQPGELGYGPQGGGYDEPPF